MPMPPELLEEPEETTVIGDVDAFIDYVESGRAERDWHEQIALRLRQLEQEDLFCTGLEIKEENASPAVGAVESVSGPVVHTTPGEVLPELSWHGRFQRGIQKLR